MQTEDGFLWHTARVINRTITWVLAATMSLCAIGAVPVAPGFRLTDGSRVVWRHELCDERKVQLQTPVERPGTPEPKERVAYSSPLLQSSFNLPPLFQRPPPALL